MNRRERRALHDRQRVLGCLLLDNGGPLHVFDLHYRTGLRMARVYVAVAALERDGIVRSKFEDGPYPRRRCYWLR